MYWIIFILNTLFLTFILLYSVVQLCTTILYLKSRKQKRVITPVLVDYPVVTVQLPVYNEKYVITRLIAAVTKFEYPRDKLEIQVLDDSDDETIDIIKECVQLYQKKGFDIKQIIRSERVDFKAGALSYGLQESKGEFVVVFDADFIPFPDFLSQTIPYFQDESVGVVQARWGHLNETYSILTQLQAYALNAHFIIEQTGRNSRGHFINFNGTAGVWRSQTIEDAGGWEGDTLTEDLDLSYRAQLKGWKFRYLEEVIAPAELPAEMNALKSQQFRWAKGAAECTRKNLLSVLKASDKKVSTKIHAFFHLLNSFIWVCLLCSAVLLLPFQYVVDTQESFRPYLNVFIVFELSFFFLFFFYITANVVANQSNSWQKAMLMVPLYPLFLTFSMGLSIYNTIGVIEGYFGKKSPFIRTPKFNITNSNDSIRTKAYVSMKINAVSLAEFFMLIYFSYSCYMTYQYQNYQALVFLLMMVSGIALVFIMSVFHHVKANSNA